MAHDLIAVRASGDDPDGRKLFATIHAHLALERARSLRALLVHVVAVLSAPVGLLAVRPDWLSAIGRRVTLVGWALSAAAAVGAFVRERRWQLRRDVHAAGIRVPMGDGPSGRNEGEDA